VTFKAQVTSLAHRLLKSYVRCFPVSKGKSRLVSRVWKPLSGGNYLRETHLRQGNVRMRCDISKLVQRQLYFFGTYEEKDCACWMRMAKQARTIFDVGANIGLYSLLAAAVNPRATIHAFEPTSEAFDRFVENLQLNHFANVVPNPVAVGHGTGKSLLHFCAGSDGANEGMNYVSPESVCDSDLEIDVVSLDDYCRRNGIASLNLLKLDIEGSEYEALLGAQNLLSKQAIGCIFLELTEWAAERKGHSIRDLKQLLAGAGYQIYQLQEKSQLKLVESDASHNGDNVLAFASRPSSL